VQLWQSMIGRFTLVVPVGVGNILNWEEC